MKNFLLFLLFLLSICSINAQQNSLQHIRVNGLSIVYQKTGKGPAIVLLHGFTQDLRVWKKQIDRLSKNFTVVAWDAPGAGISDDPPDNYAMNDWADCLATFLDSLRIKQAHILGISWGGVLAQAFYQRHPEKVLSLILADTNAGWSSFEDSTADVRLEACIRDTARPADNFVQKYLPVMFGEKKINEPRSVLHTR